MSVFVCSRVCACVVFVFTTDCVCSGMNWGVNETFECASAYASMCLCFRACVCDCVCVCVRGKSHKRVPADSDHFLCLADPSQSVVSLPCIRK